MLADQKKISIRQACLILLSVYFSPNLSIIPNYGAKSAKQAAWLSPVFTVVLLFLLTLVWYKFYKKYNDFSLMDIYSDISGKVIGKILAMIYLVWVVILIALYTRYFATRLGGSILPDIDMRVVIISLLLLIGYALHYGITTIARMTEVIFPLLTVFFYLLVIMLIPDMRIENLTPVTYRDVYPAIKASIGGTGIISYFTFLFILGKRINNKEKIGKYGLWMSIFLLIQYTCLIAATIGTFTFSVIERAQVPFLIAVKQISFFNTLEKIESIVFSLWIASDFILISFFILCAFELMKYCFKISDEKPLINIFIVFIYLLSMYLVSNAFELQKLSIYIIVPGDIILGFGIPTIMLILGKIRKKI